MINFSDGGVCMNTKAVKMIAFSASIVNLLGQQLPMNLSVAQAPLGLSRLY